MQAGFVLAILIIIGFCLFIISQIIGQAIIRDNIRLAELKRTKEKESTPSIGDKYWSSGYHKHEVTVFDVVESDEDPIIFFEWFEKEAKYEGNPLQRIEKIVRKTDSKTLNIFKYTYRKLKSTPDMEGKALRELQK